MLTVPDQPFPLGGEGVFTCQCGNATGRNLDERVGQDLRFAVVGKRSQRESQRLCSAERPTGNDVVSLIGLKPGILINMDIRDAEVIARGRNWELS